MSMSLPSRQVIVVDIPEVRDFNAEFVYNFFTPDEAVSLTGGVPKFIIEKNSEAFDSPFVDQITSRVPRFIKFSFTPILIKEANVLGDSQVRDHALSVFQKSKFGLIKNNLDKVLTEDTMSSMTTTALNFNDQMIDKKLFQLISGTAVFLTDEKKRFESLTKKSLAKETNSLTTDAVTFNFLTKFLVQPSEDNVFFYERDSQRIRNDAVNRLKDVNVHLQINNRFFHHVVKQGSQRPHSTFASDLLSLVSTAKFVEDKEKRKNPPHVTDSDYTFTMPYVELQRAQTATASSPTLARTIGYIIDKFEVSADGTLLEHPPIIIESPEIHSTIDFRVRYGATYVYSVRTVAELIIPSIVEDTKELVVAKFLVSSRPSRQRRIVCNEIVPPPSPVDLNFRWNHSERAMCVVWAFPPNPQRDIKKFQVFRRKNINEPFQLIKMFDFDDSVVKAESRENVPLYLIEKNLNPQLLFYDYEFTKDSKFIYALCAIDAHGFTSNYSEQFEVTFDKAKNRLKKRRISSSGAPKAYPNMNLDADTFLDAIVDADHKTMKIIFDPDHISLFDANNSAIRCLATSRDGAKYRLQIINTDLQKEKAVNITIDDRRTFSNKNR